MLNVIQGQLPPSLESLGFIILHAQDDPRFYSNVTDFGVVLARFSRDSKLSRLRYDRFWYLQIDDLDISPRSATIFLKVIFASSDNVPPKVSDVNRGRDSKRDGSGSRDRSRSPLPTKPLSKRSSRPVFCPSGNGPQDIGVQDVPTPVECLVPSAPDLTHCVQASDHPSPRSGSPFCPDFLFPGCGRSYSSGSVQSHFCSHIVSSAAVPCGQDTSELLGPQFEPWRSSVADDVTARSGCPLQSAFKHETKSATEIADDDGNDQRIHAFSSVDVDSRTNEVAHASGQEPAEVVSSLDATIKMDEFSSAAGQTDTAKIGIRQPFDISPTWTWTQLPHDATDDFRECEPQQGAPFRLPIEFLPGLGPDLSPAGLVAMYRHSELAELGSFSGVTLIDLITKVRLQVPAAHSLVSARAYMLRAKGCPTCFCVCQGPDCSRCNSPTSQFRLSAPNYCCRNVADEIFDILSNSPKARRLAEAAP